MLHSFRLVLHWSICKREVWQHNPFAAVATRVCTCFCALGARLGAPKFRNREPRFGWGGQKWEGWWRFIPRDWSRTIEPRFHRPGGGPGGGNNMLSNLTWCQVWYSTWQLWGLSLWLKISETVIVDTFYLASKCLALPCQIQGIQIVPNNSDYKALGKLWNLSDFAWHKFFLGIKCFLFGGLCTTGVCRNTLCFDLPSPFFGNGIIFANHQRTSPDEFRAKKSSFWEQ